jgi:tol-pal system protein YbgF
MFKYLRSSVAVALVAGGMLVTPAQAQSAAEIAVRMSQLEDEIRQLTGQVEQLTYEVKQLRNQAGATKSGAAESLQAVPKTKLAATDTTEQPAAAATGNGDQIVSQSLAPVSGEEQITDNGQSDVGGGQPAPLNKAPGPQVLGSIGGTAAKAGDGGFQGQILVAPSQEDAPAVQLQPAVQDPAVEQGSLTSNGMVEQGTLNGNSGVEQVALAPDTPESLYERSNESLLRRQFSDAEAGFRNFLAKFPDHSLAGSAQYWLGETYYAQTDYRQAAQAFLKGYQQYPNSRRAADSLLKLGISLGKLGQKQQACAAFDSVSSEYPKAVEARKRAQAESTRAGCAS